MFKFIVTFLIEFEKLIGVKLRDYLKTEPNDRQ